MTANGRLEDLLRTIAVTRAGDLRSLAVLELHLDEDEVTPVHSHDHDEAFHVLEGALVVHLADRSVLLRRGDGFTAPARLPHALAARPGGVRYLVASFTPSLAAYADFQRAVAVPGPASAAEDEDVVRAIAREAGIDVHGPPGPLPGSA